ncbi:phytanoyl-CoA dioxygenase family protein [Bernardetia sp.]|uniref:phytanoyl-CoA dioxygenase family protein n=1 Tax=Bernardetia sp. TaxID=1937974 RepID=UPI0025C6CA6C|nr:phytanoyl-CoA dioxygenase family protein [Bernardetia sp.]
MQLIFDKWDSDLIPQYKDAVQKTGFLHIRNYITPKEIENIFEAQANIEKKWIEEDKEEMFGVPILYGKDLDGKTIIHRSPFMSLNTSYFEESGLISRMKKLLEVVGKEFRIGENENDGIVFNHYLKKEQEASRRKLGWHTDSGRDFWSLEKPKLYYNIGIHLDDCPKNKGGLRLLLGSHLQSISSMLFKKWHFIDHRQDKNEYCVETRAGDMTIHDARIWHRVAECPAHGEASRRRVLYIPFVRGEVKEKTEQSKPPIYLVILKKINKVKSSLLQ